MFIQEIHKKWSVWTTALLALVAILEPHWPELSAKLPESWVAIGAAVILIARILRQNPPSGGAGGATLLVVGAILLSGCAVPLEQARSAGMESRNLGASPAPELTVYCRKLDSARTTWGAIAKASGALSGAGGIAVIPIKSDNAETIVAASSIAAAALGLVAVYVSDQKDEAWARDCSGER
jgi:hypothetical protein